MSKCLTFKELVLLSPTPIIRDMQQTAADLQVTQTLLEALRDLQCSDHIGAYRHIQSALETLGLPEASSQKEADRLTRERQRG